MGQDRAKQPYIFSKWHYFIQKRKIRVFGNISVILLKLGQIYSFFLQIWECTQIIHISKTQDIILPFKVDKIQLIEVFTELWHANEVEKIPNKMLPPHGVKRRSLLCFGSAIRNKWVSSQGKPALLSIVDISTINQITNSILSGSYVLVSSFDQNNVSSCSLYMLIFLWLRLKMQNIKSTELYLF